MPLHPNQALQQAIEKSGYTQDDLAEAINEEHEKLYGSPGRCSDRQVRRLLTGEVAWPRDATRLPLEAVLGRRAVELGFRSPPQAALRGRTVRAPAPVDEELPVRRRRFVLSAGTLVALPVLPEAGRIDMSDIARIRGAEARLVQLDDRHGSAELAGVAGRYVAHVEHTMRHCSYGSRVQTALHQALGEMCAQAGWLAYDSQQHEQARRHWRGALQYARLAKSSDLEARVWSCMSRQAVDLGHGSEAVAIARTALDATRGRREPRLSALLHTRVALGHSVTGQRGRCGQSLHRAEQELDRASPQPPPWLAFCGPAELTGQAALCHYNLGDFTDALQADREARTLMGVGEFRRNAFATHVSLARNALAAGEPEEALAAGHRALDLLPEVRSPRWTAHLRGFGRSLGQRGSSPVTAEFLERYRKVAA